jgi:hypothetical protein
MMLISSSVPAMAQIRTPKEGIALKMINFPVNHCPAKSLSRKEKMQGHQEQNCGGEKKRGKKTIHPRHLMSFALQPMGCRPTSLGTPPRSPQLSPAFGPWPA